MAVKVGPREARERGRGHPLGEAPHAGKVAGGLGPPRGLRQGRGAARQVAEDALGRVQLLAHHRQGVGEMNYSAERLRPLWREFPVRDPGRFPTFEPQSRGQHRQRRRLVAPDHPAVRQSVGALRQRLLADLAADRVGLRRAIRPRVEYDQLGTSFLRFVPKEREERSRGGVQDRAVEPGLLPHELAGLLGRPPGGGGHVRDRQSLGHDQPVPAREPRRDLVVAVLAPVGDLRQRLAISRRCRAARLIACRAAPSRAPSARP